MATTAISKIEVNIDNVFTLLEKSETRLLNTQKYFDDNILLLESDIKNDEALKSFIARATNTVKDINEQRMVYTKKLDEIKSKFTNVENTIKNYIGKAQDKRNEIAKVELDKAKQQELQRKQEELKQLEVVELRRQCEIDLASYFEKMVDDFNAACIKSYHTITSENFNEKVEKIKKMDNLFNEKKYKEFIFGATSKFGHDVEAIRCDILIRNIEKYKKLFNEKVIEIRNELLVLAQKKIGGATQEDLVFEQQKVVVDKTAIEIRAACDKTEVLFNTAQESEQSAKINASEKLVLEVISKAGYQAVVQFWFEHLFKDEDESSMMNKSIKSMINDINRFSNKHKIFLESEYAKYKVDVKAK